MPATIARERPDTPDAICLIDALQTHLEQFYPPESRHGFNVEKLLAQGVAFFLVREDTAPAACGGILLVDGEYGELKRMYVRPEFRGRGFGKLLIEHLASYARAHGIPYSVQPAHVPTPKRASYPDNFRFDRKTPWTH